MSNITIIIIIIIIIVIKRGRSCKAGRDRVLDILSILRPYLQKPTHCTNQK